MRYYVRKEDLVLTLNELTRNKNQNVVSVYKDVMMYHYSSHPQDFKHVKRMLLMPRKFLMGAVNFLLAILALLLLPEVADTAPMQAILPVLPSILYAFAGWQLIVLYQTGLKINEFYPYVVIDELLARNIIVLAPKAKPVKKIKTAE